MGPILIQKKSLEEGPISSSFLLFVGDISVVYIDWPVFWIQTLARPIKQSELSKVIFSGLHGPVVAWRV